MRGFTVLKTRFPRSLDQSALSTTKSISIPTEDLLIFSLKLSFLFFHNCASCERKKTPWCKLDWGLILFLLSSCRNVRKTIVSHKSKEFRAQIDSFSHSNWVHTVHDSGILTFIPSKCKTRPILSLRKEGKPSIYAGLQPLNILGVSSSE